MAYGATPAYGSVSALDPAMVTSHRINLAGLAPSTIYHYKVVSRDAQGRIAESGDFAFTTSATTGSQILLQLRSDASEVSGVTNGSIVTPAQITCWIAEISDSSMATGTLPRPTTEITPGVTRTGKRS